MFHRSRKNNPITVFKAKEKIAYADCFAAALAREKKAQLVTGDPEFKPLEDEVNILWIK
jgi:hypothetical protein